MASDGDLDGTAPVSPGEVLRSRGWREAFTTEQMVRAWSHLVRTVETGYDEMVYEYLNDLSCRNWLHEAWILLPDAELIRWSPEVEQLDRRFRAATVDDDGAAIGEYYRLGVPDRWWLRRYPRLLVGDLAADLKPYIASNP